MPIKNLPLSIVVSSSRFTPEPGGVFTLPYANLGLPDRAIPDSIEMETSPGDRRIFDLVEVCRDNGEFVCALYVWSTGGWKLKVMA